MRSILLVPSGNTVAVRPVVAIDARLVSSRSTGDSTYWRGLLTGFAQIQADFDLLLLSNDAPAQNVPEVPGARWVTGGFRSSRLWSLVSFPMLASRHGANVIHTQYSLSPLAGKQGVTTVHDVSFLIEPAWFEPRDRFLLSRTVPAALARCARAVTVSESSRAEIERLVPASRGKVSVTRLAPAPGIEPPGSLAGLDVPDRYLLAVGTPWKRKNVALAVETARRVGLPLVLTGRAEPTWDAVRVGYVEERQLSALYAGAEALLVPSFHEGFGLPVVEAFACGCPVVCSEGGSLPEVAGGAARIVRGFDPERWAEEVSNLIGDTSILAEMRHKGELRAKEFSWKKCAEETLAVYREVAG